MYIYLYIYNIYMYNTYTYILYICICVFLEPTFFFHMNAFRGEINTYFSKCYIEKKRTIQTQVKFSSLLEN